MPLFDERYPQLDNKERQAVVDFCLNFLKVAHATLGYEFIANLGNIAQSLGMKGSKPLDVSVPSAFALMALWRNEIDDSIILIHDSSSPMAASINLWETLVHPHAPFSAFWPSTSTIAFPISIEGTYPSSSKDWVGLQLADILAGASAYWAKWLTQGRKPHDEYGTKLDTIIPKFPLSSNQPVEEMTLKDFEENGLTEEEVLQYNELFQKITAFHQLRKYGYSYRINP